MGAVAGIARVFAFRGKHQSAIFTRNEAVVGQAWGQHFVRGTWPGSAFQAQQLARAKVGEYRLYGVDDETEVWLAMAVQRRWYADDQSIRLGCARKVCRGLKPLSQGVVDALWRQSLDVAVPTIQEIYLASIYVEADNFHADFAEAQRQGQTDIAEAIYADNRSS